MMRRDNENTQCALQLFPSIVSNDFTPVLTLNQQSEFIFWLLFFFHKRRSSLVDVVQPPVPSEHEGIDDRSQASRTLHIRIRP